MAILKIVLFLAIVLSGHHFDLNLTNKDSAMHIIK